MFDQAEYLQELETLVNTDSGSANVKGVNAIADFFEQRFSTLGWHFKRKTITEQAGDLLDMCSAPAERYDILFIGHMDTVFGEGEAARRPFTIRDGRAYGPGVADMKCGLLAIWHVVKGLSEQAQKLSIRVIMNPDEEIFSVYSTPYIAEAAKTAERVLVMEPAMGDGSICPERKGKLQYTFQFHGIATHAGYVFDRVNASAVYEMAKWIEALMALGDREKGTTVNVGRVSGGEAANIVADYAQLEVEFRMWEKDETERIKAALDKMEAEPFIDGIRVVRSYSYELKPMVPSAKTKAFVELMRTVYEKHGLSLSVARSGGVSDGNIAAEFAPVVVDRIGPWGDHNHSINEYMVTESARYSVEILQDLLEEVAKLALTDN